jgi:serine/threonine protein kinase
MRLGDDRHLGCSDLDMLDATIGTRGGPPTIVRLLGAGSLSKVYAAEHPVLKPLRVVTLPGTPAYMAPEQLRGTEVSAAADISSLGITAYQLSTDPLGDQLGTGGMAEVFTGTMIGVEAQIAAQLAHPNIVSVLDFSRDLDDRLFLVMKYVDGKDAAGGHRVRLANDDAGQDEITTVTVEPDSTVTVERSW